MSDLPKAPIDELIDAIDQSQVAHHHDERAALVAVLRAMRGVDAVFVTKSLYRELSKDEQDEPPDGDAFIELWEAVIGSVCKRAGVKYPVGI